MKKEKSRLLPNRIYIEVVCPNCDGSEVHEREGVEPGHSYLEGYGGEEYECSFCQGEIVLGDGLLYGFVRN